MRVEFELNYRVASGEAICVEFYGSATIVQMESHDGEWWRLTLDGVEPQSYGYLLCRDGEVVRRETRVKERLIEQTKGIDMVVKHDRWSEYEELRPLYSSLFTNVVFRRESPRSVELSKRGVTTVIECVAARIESSQAIAIVGDGQMLGEWGASGKVEMCDAEFPLWRVALPNVERHSEFKFVVVDRESGEIISWESGENRMLTPYRGEQGGLMSLDFVSCSTPHFDTPLWQGIGVSIPIFSLRTDRSMGIGDFGDIRSMVDWAVARDMSVLQILPINDTIMGGTWEDSYPYNSNSTIALHPQYLALREVGCIDDDELRAKFEAKAAELNALPKIDYTAVMALKMEYLREIFRKDKAATLKSKAYRGFVEQNSWWLTPYALFSMLRDRFSTPDFREWGDYAKYSEKLTEGLNRKEQSEVNFYCFLQYHLHIQLLAASNYARSRGVAIKGDIPIGVSRTSVDVWQHPDLFSLDMQAGAPPDPFSALGQNWGFPTYNWELMAKDGYSWWRARFEKMAEYFDAYRIDHILGFFRIWEIPLGSVHGLTGHFNPALPLSKSQLLEWRLEFRDEYTQPYITDEVLSMHFQSDIKEIKKNYLSKSKSGGYRFKREFDTQRKVADKVADEALREGLMLLHNEVLFVEDPHSEGSYHPRIAGGDTYIFKLGLSESEQRAFCAIHDDFYYSRHNDFWRESALRKLPSLVRSTSMMVCGEDLGMIPDCVADVMASEQILSLEIERMPKQFGVAFGDPATCPYLSVCTTSTHDMTTIRGWWQEDEALTRRYCREAFGVEAESVCSGEMAQRIIDRHLATEAMLTILPWQDWMAVDEALRNPDVDAERINVPANSRHYWRYRMHVTLE